MACVAHREDRQLVCSIVNHDCALNPPSDNMFGQDARKVCVQYMTPNCLGLGGSSATAVYTIWNQIPTLPAYKYPALQHTSTWHRQASTHAHLKLHA
jgi:hypothetical protein